MVMKLLEKELQKINQQKFWIEKVIKKRGDKLHVKWKGYDSSFNNSWIDKKDIIKVQFYRIKMRQLYLNSINHFAEILMLKFI